MKADSFEYYGELDELGRCTVAYIDAYLTY